VDALHRTCVDAAFIAEELEEALEVRRRVRGYAGAEGPLVVRTIPGSAKSVEDGGGDGRVRR
jgi:hypothetical protein